MIRKENIVIRSRSGRNIAATVMIPEEGRRLLMMAHGFKSERTEDGRYTECGRRLAEKGFCSIMMAFPEVSELSMDRCLEYMEDCYQYMVNNYGTQMDNAAVIGYSLGGRLASLFVHDHPDFTDLVLWASCNQNFTEDDDFLEQNLGRMLREGMKEGYADFHDIFTGENDRMPVEFIRNLLDHDALTALNDYKGRVLIVQGRKDITIDVRNAEWIYDSLVNCQDKQLYYMDEADHGFGIFDGRMQDSEELVSTTVSFLSKLS